MVCVLPVSSAFGLECPKGPYVYFSEVTKAHDGGTITTHIDLGFHTCRKDGKLRLHGIDAPEVIGKQSPLAPNHAICSAPKS